MEDTGVLWPSHSVVVSLGQDLLATILLLMTVSSVGFHSGILRGNIWIANESARSLTLLDARINRVIATPDAQFVHVSLKGENPGAKIEGRSVAGNTQCFQMERYPAKMCYERQYYSQNRRYFSVFFPVLGNCAIRMVSTSRREMLGSRDLMDFKVLGGWHRGCEFSR